MLHLACLLDEVHTNCTRSEHKEHNGLINYYTQIAHIGNILAATLRKMFGVVVPGSWNRYTHPALQNSA